VVPHELTHVEQLYLLANRKADVLGIKAVPTPQQATELSDLMEANLSFTTPDRLLFFLKHRAGRPLTDEAAERADRIGASFSDLGKAMTKVDFTARASAIDKIKTTSPRNTIDWLFNGDDGKDLAATLTGEYDAGRKSIQLKKKYGSLPKNLMVIGVKRWIGR